MATPNKRADRAWAASSRIARGVTLVFGISAIFWSVQIFPTLMQQDAVKQIASEVLSGNRFKSGFLNKVIRENESAQASACNPSVAHDMVILSAAVVDEAATSADKTAIDRAYGQANDTARRSIACTPTDSFAWLTLFWLASAKQGFSPEADLYLRMSYRLGPNEGWISLWRNRLVMAIYSQLPGDLANEAVNEFIRLLETGRVYSDMANIFVGTTETARNRISERLKTSNATSTRIFAEVLSEKGVDANFNGVERSNRPWR
jgi:hypothetical protein